MVTDFPIQGIIDHLVERIVDILPVDHAAVTVMTPGQEPRCVSASDALATVYARLQSDCAQGPCVSICESDSPTAIPNLLLEDRFPEFIGPARQAGLAAFFTFPLRHADQQLGALALYRDTPGALSKESFQAAQTLADVASAYLLNARVRDELREAWRRTKEESLHDGLTGLANRQLLVSKLDNAFRRSRQSGKTVAVLFLDLDRLNSVNDTYGHRVGDQLLLAVARRLASSLRPGDTLARLAGDEFVVVCEELEDSAQAAAIGHRLLDIVGRPFRLSSIDIEITASIGLAYAEHGESTPDQLLNDADVAMYHAKGEGGDRQKVFDERVKYLIAPAAGLARDLGSAIERGQLRNEYQPIVATVDGRITGFEALVRWAHPSRGEVPPATLIPLAEESDLINEIGQWVLGTAWADRGGWVGSGSAGDLAMSVNVSAHQIMSEGFVDIVAGVVKTFDADPHLLTLEITESVFLHDTEYALSTLGRVRDLGVKLALDDFGTGYSSLSYFKRFPVDIIKIDQSFVVDLAHNRTSKAVVGAVVALAHDLGMTVIAEGVETAAQYDAVRDLGCDSSQGYYFGRPMSSSRIDRLMHHHPNGNDLAILGSRLPSPRKPALVESAPVGLTG